MPASALLALSLAVAPVDAPHLEALVLAPQTQTSSGRDALELWLSVSSVVPAGAIRFHAEPEPKVLARYGHALGTPPAGRSLEASSLKASVRAMRQSLAQVPPGRRRLLYVVALDPDPEQSKVLVHELPRIEADRLHLVTNARWLADAIARERVPGVVLLCPAGASRFTAAVAGLFSGTVDANRDGQISTAEAGASLVRTCGPIDANEVLAGDETAPVIATEGIASIVLDEALDGEYLVQPVFASAPWLALEKAAGTTLELRAPAAFLQVLRRERDGAGAGTAFLLRPGERRTLTSSSFNLSAQLPKTRAPDPLLGADEVAEFEAARRPSSLALRLGAGALGDQKVRGMLELGATLHGEALFGGVALDTALGAGSAWSVGAEVHGGYAWRWGRALAGPFMAVGVQTAAGSGLAPRSARIGAGMLAEARCTERWGLFARAEFAGVRASGWSAQGRASAGASVWW